MSRTRLIRAGFFKHAELYQAEAETGLPLRVAFAGLWTVADRDGRFKWKPDLKPDILPYDPVDFLAVLDALERHGFVRSYVVDGKRYGVIDSFAEHQSFHKSERPSQLPAPPPRTGTYRGSNGETTDTAPPVTRTITASNTASNTSSSAQKPADGDTDPEGFPDAWREYPRRAGSNPRHDARRAYHARLREGVSPSDLLAGVIRYRQFCEATGKIGTEYVQRASTFFGKGRGFAELWTLPAVNPPRGTGGPSSGTVQGERARWIWRVAQEFRLLSAVPDILERIDHAVQAAPEGDRDRLRADLLAVKIWELGSEREERFALKRIEERLGDAARGAA